MSGAAAADKSLLFSDYTEERMAVYSGKPHRHEVGVVTLNGATPQLMVVDIEGMIHAGNVQIIAECVATGANSTQVSFAVAPRVQRLNGELTKSVSAAVVVGTETSDLRNVGQEPEVLDVPLHTRDRGTPRHCMTPYGFNLYVAAEAGSTSQIAISVLLF